MGGTTPHRRILLFCKIVYIYFLLFEENHENRISRAGEQNLHRFRSFFVKWLFKYQSLAVINSLRIEHFCDIIPKAQSWLVLSLPVFMFVYIHVNVPPLRITDLVIRWKDLLIWNSQLCLCFCFYQLGLCSVSYTANDSIYHFWYYDKRLPFLFQEWLLSKTLKL